MKPAVDLYETPCSTPDPYGIGPMIHNRFAKGWTYATPCHNFSNAIFDAFPEDKALKIKGACLLTVTWQAHCLTAASMAHDAGLPVETIRFLAALHLGDVING